MKIVFVHYSLKVYWVPRLEYLYKECSKQNINFSVVELVGNSSVYTFDGSCNERSWWRCLFPEHNPESVDKKDLAKELFGALDELNPDIIVAGSIVFTCGALSLRWANKNHKKVISFDDVKSENIKRSKIVNYVKAKLFERVDGYFAPSKSYIDDLKTWGFGEENIILGLNAIDNQYFRKKNTDALQSYNFKQFRPCDKTKYIICVARLVHVKNHRTMLLAWEKFSKSANAEGLWNLLLVGDGPLEKTLKGLVKDNNIPYVEFLGPVSQMDLPYYYSISHSAILPSFSESWGLVINEAMAAGLPILISDKCNCKSDLLIEGVNGFSFDPYSEDSILHSLNRVRMRDDLTDMGIKSLEVIDQFDLKNFATNLLLGIKKLSQQPHRKSSIISNILIHSWKGKLSISGFNEAMK
ncbi:glycosyltransferase family 4 protein [Flavisolibacter sp. BT320]|nr:glycosyltransferase family 4 protein [Flavisolibacter longurius]